MTELRDTLQRHPQLRSAFASPALLHALHELRRCTQESRLAQHRRYDVGHEIVLPERGRR